MKKLLFVISVLLFTSLIYGQSETFVFLKTGSEDSGLYARALMNADLDIYRLKEGRRLLNFESGVVVELLSVTELKQKGLWNNAFDGHEGVDLVYSGVFQLGNGNRLVVSQRVNNNDEGSKQGAINANLKHEKSVEKKPLNNN
jgi:hypothetical protein